MYNFFVEEFCGEPVKILIIMESQYELWKEKQSQVIKNKLETQKVQGKAGELCLIDDAQGNFYLVLSIVSSNRDYLTFGGIFSFLPSKVFEIEMLDFTNEDLNYFALGWGMSAYRFLKQKNAEEAKLFLTPRYQKDWINLRLNGIFRVRDLINSPANLLYPQKLAELIRSSINGWEIKFDLFEGERLAKEFPMVAAVGKGSENKPLLVELEYGKEGDPKIALVGKGVCFDAGGLDLKISSSMLDMKKDMAGAAHAFALMEMVMQAKLPIHLKVLLPLVENLPSGTAYKPRDILISRLGKTVEVLNTDAEGRLILADALTYASEWKPELIIDFATLTGAATVALGNDLSAIFSNNVEKLTQIKECLKGEGEAVWELPLYQPYAKTLRSSVADLANIPEENIGGGAITAALFLENFVTVPWIHLDIFAYNKNTKAGLPKGGEAVVLKGIFSYLTSYSKKDV